MHDRQWDAMTTTVPGVSRARSMIDPATCPTDICCLLDPAHTVSETGSSVSGWASGTGSAGSAISSAL